MNTIKVSNRLDPDQARHFVGLIWVQTVCKGYHQTVLSRQRVKGVGKIDKIQGFAEHDIKFSNQFIQQESHGGPDRLPLLGL